MMIAFANGPHTGFDRVGWCVEIMIPDGKDNYVLACVAPGHGGGVDLPAILAGWRDAGDSG
jgi:hypothetical protein